MKMKFITALIKSPMRDFFLTDKDDNFIMKFSWCHSTSPSFSPVWDEEVEFDYDDYEVRIKFLDVTSSEFMKRIKEYNK